MRRSRHTYDESLGIHRNQSIFAVNIVYCIVELIHEIINILLSTSSKRFRDSSPTVAIDRSAQDTKRPCRNLKWGTRTIVKSQKQDLRGKNRAIDFLTHNRTVFRSRLYFFFLFLAYYLSHGLRRVASVALAHSWISTNRCLIATRRSARARNAQWKFVVVVVNPRPRARRRSSADSRALHHVRPRPRIGSAATLLIYESVS